jgi:hypothetical protein
MRSNIHVSKVEAGIYLVDTPHDGRFELTRGSYIDDREWVLTTVATRVESFHRTKANALAYLSEIVDGVNVGVIG